MKQFKKYCVGMLLLVTLVFVTACGNSNNGTATDNAGTGTTGETGTTTDGDASGNGAANGDVTGDGTNAGNGMNIDDVLFDTDDDGVYDHTDIDGDGLLEEIGRDSNDVVDDLVDDVTGGDGILDDGADNGMVDGAGTVENGNGTTTP